MHDLKCPKLDSSIYTGEYFYVTQGLHWNPVLLSQNSIDRINAQVSWEQFLFFVGSSRLISEWPFKPIVLCINTIRCNLLYDWEFANKKFDICDSEAYIGEMKLAQNHLLY